MAGLEVSALGEGGVVQLLRMVGEAGDHKVVGHPPFVHGVFLFLECCGDVGVVVVIVKAHVLWLMLLEEVVGRCKIVFCW